MKLTIKIFLVLCLTLFICTSCSDDNKNTSNVSKKSEEKDNILHCTRVASAGENTKTSLKYSIYYDGDYVTKTVSIEKITSSDNSILKQYKDAYENVFETYKNIDYYDNKVEQNGDTVTSTTVIDYEHVDTKLLLEIEGEDGNIFDDDGKVKKETLVTMFKKYGAKCE